MKPLGEYEVWLVTGSQEMYGDETLRQVAANSKRIAAELDSSPALPVRVVHRPVVTSSESIATTCRDANASDSCVGVILWMHTFSPARMWIAGLQAIRKPLLHLHTQFNRDLPWAEIDMDFMNLHQSAHGDREFGYLATRMQVARKTVAGHWQDPQVVGRIATWARAACAWQDAQHLTVARFGDTMRHVADTEGDKVEAQIKLGVAVNGYGVSDLSDAIRAVPGAAIDDLVQRYEQEYDLAPELAEGGDRRGALLDAARIEAGLRGFLAAGGHGAFTDTFENLDGLRQLPGLAVQRLMADGFGFGAEGDWKTAALVRLVKVMATGLPGGTSFMEDYTYDLDPAAPKVLGAHMLEVCPSIARSRPRCEIHALSIGSRSDPVRLVFDADTGPAVVAGMTDLGERFRIVANVVDIVDAGHELPRLPVARAVWQPRPDLRTAVEGWLIAGGAHHTVLSRAVGPEPLADFAEMAGIEFVLIDEETRVSAVQKELRWNAAYYHLVRGL
jgi:L-arabinose isomerase